VGPLLRNALRRLGLDRRMAEQRAVEAWPAVVGPEIAAHARAAGVREGVLFVEVESSVWMQELGLLRDGIAARLNAHLGATHVQRIVLSIGRQPLAAGGGTPEGEVEGPHGQ
jgi:predicted nucleic acid-binding Zn ribbon protein